MRLIDADALINRIVFHSDLPFDQKEAFEDEINAEPSVQPERGTGAWIINDEYPQHCWCSECNHFFSLFDPKSIHFCPNCGSEMKTCILKSQYEKEN